MASSKNAYIVGMSDAVRRDLIGALERCGYRRSQANGHMRVLSRQRYGVNEPSLVVVDLDEITPGCVSALAAPQDSAPGDKIILVGQCASLTLADEDLPKGPWGLMPRSATVQSLGSLVAFLSGHRPILH